MRRYEIFASPGHRVNAGFSDNTTSTAWNWTSPTLRVWNCRWKTTVMVPATTGVCGWPQPWND